MQNVKQQPPRTQASNWLTLNCGQRMLFADVVAKAAERQAQLSELAREYQARNAKLNEPVCFAVGDI